MDKVVLSVVLVLAVIYIVPFLVYRLDPVVADVYFR